MFQLPIIP